MIRGNKTKMITKSQDELQAHNKQLTTEWFCQWRKATLNKDVQLPPCTLICTLSLIDEWFQL